MGIEDAQRRLAAQVEDSDEADAPDVVDEAKSNEPETGGPPVTVRDLLNLTTGSCAPTIIGLKTMGMLADDGEAMVYTLAESPKPIPGVIPPGLTKIRLTKVVKGKHRRRMLIHGEPNGEGEIVPLRQVLLSWVAALADKPMALIDELGKDDCDALMCIAQWIETSPGNG